MTEKKWDVLVLIFLLCLTVLLVRLSKGLWLDKGLITFVFFCIPPVLYLSLRSRKNWKKIAISVLVFGGAFGFILDFLAELNKSWTVTSTIFPFRIFGVNTLDSVISIMLMTLLTLVFYEHFLDREINHHISKNLKFAIFPTIFVCISIVFLFNFKPDLLKFNYPYLVMGLAAIIPPIVLSYSHPGLIKKMATTGIYFFFLYLIIELISVDQGYWHFSGNNYVGLVNIKGIIFPFEEVFFWMIFYAASVVSYYEIFVDDEK